MREMRLILPATSYETPEKGGDPVNQPRVHLYVGEKAALTIY